MTRMRSSAHAYRPITVQRPHVDLPAHVYALRMYRVPPGDKAPAEISWVDADSGLIVYTTPLHPSLKVAWARAIAWLRRHGFAYRVTPPHQGCYVREAPHVVTARP